MPPKLTAYTFFAEHIEAELKGKEVPRSRVSAIEVSSRWRSLSEADRKPWDEKAAAAQETYLQECTQRFVDAGDDDNGEEANDDNEDEANGEEEEPTEGQTGDDADCRATAKLNLPTTRVKKIAQVGAEDGRIVGKEAIFTISKVRRACAAHSPHARVCSPKFFACAWCGPQACEVFIDRSVWGTVRYMSRSGRKVLNSDDLIAALKLHPSPEVMQFFVDELQPAPPPPPPKPTKPTAKGKKENKKKEAENKKAEVAKGAESKKAEGSKGGKRKAPEAAPAPEESVEPPKKRGPGRPKKSA